MKSITDMLILLLMLLIHGLVVLLITTSNSKGTCTMHAAGIHIHMLQEMLLVHSKNGSTLLRYWITMMRKSILPLLPVNWWIRRLALPLPLLHLIQAIVVVQEILRYRKEGVTTKQAVHLLLLYQET